ncbi:MAG: helix-turn-helix domain-containing protein, partial [Acidimicrobiia bacterium]
MTTTRVDRAALVRRAMVEVVAEQGLNGASMSLVAKRAGVATGTPYVHYDSKDDLLIASFVEAKR